LKVFGIEIQCPLFEITFIVMSERDDAAGSEKKDESDAELNLKDIMNAMSSMKVDIQTDIQGLKDAVVSKQEVEKSMSERDDAAESEEEDESDDQAKVIYSDRLRCTSVKRFEDKDLQYSTCEREHCIRAAFDPSGTLCAVVLFRTGGLFLHVFVGPSFERTTSKKLPKLKNPMLVISKQSIIVAGQEPESEGKGRSLYFAKDDLAAKPKVELHVGHLRCLSQHHALWEHPADTSDTVVKIDIISFDRLSGDNRHTTQFERPAGCHVFTASCDRYAAISFKVPAPTENTPNSRPSSPCGADEDASDDELAVVELVMVDLESGDAAELQTEVTPRFFTFGSDFFLCDGGSSNFEIYRKPTATCDYFQQVVMLRDGFEEMELSEYAEDVNSSSTGNFCGILVSESLCLVGCGGCIWEFSRNLSFKPLQTVGVPDYSQCLALSRSNLALCLVSDDSGSSCRNICFLQYALHDPIPVGICAAYLVSEDFKKLACERTKGKCEMEGDPTFKEMTAPFWKEDVQRALGLDMMSNEDGKEGVPLVEWVAKSVSPLYRGPSTHFLSWSWGYRLSTVQGGLGSWLEKKGLKAEDVFLWMCFFCNNQYRIFKATNVDAGDLEKIFRTHLVSIGKVVALLDHWSDPQYLTRVWTIYEQFVAADLKVPMEFILPPQARDTLVECFEQGRDGLLKVRASLTNVRVEKAEASQEADRVTIMAMIQGGMGYDTVNAKVQDGMLKWIMGEVEAYFRDLVHKGTAPDGRPSAAQPPRASSRLRDAKDFGDTAGMVHEKAGEQEAPPDEATRLAIEQIDSSIASMLEAKRMMLRRQAP